MSPEPFTRWPGPLAVALALALALAPSRAAAQQPAGPDAGRQFFQYGRGFYEQRQYTEALDAFRRSADALPSPNTQLYVGRCLRELGRFAEAWFELERAAEAADGRGQSDARYARTADTARQESGALADRVAFVVIEPGAQASGVTVSVNGRAFPTERMGRLYAVDPGAITVDANAGGYAPFRTTATLAAGQQARVALNLVPANMAGSMAPTSNAFTVLALGDRGALPVASVVAQPPQRSPWRAIGVTSMSLGLVAGAIGIYTGLRTAGIRNDLDAACPRGCGPTPSSTVRSQVEEGESMALYTNVLWGAGAALVVGGGIAFFASGGSAQELYTPTFARNARPRIAWSPYVDPTRGSMGLTGSF
jgi:hypothetical protein